MQFENILLKLCISLQNRSIVYYVGENLKMYKIFTVFSIQSKLWLQGKDYDVSMLNAGR